VAREDRIRLWLVRKRLVLGPVLPERVLLLLLDRGEYCVRRGHAFRKLALVIALLPEVGEPLLVCLAPLAGLLFLRDLVGPALLLGERAPPVQLRDRLVEVPVRQLLLGECPDLCKLLLQGGAERGELLALRGECRCWQVALPQSEQLDALGEVEGLRSHAAHGRER
jgi:hypothetical protein